LLKPVALLAGGALSRFAKARRELAWSPTTSFETMLAEMVDAQVKALQPFAPSARLAS